MMSPAEQHLFKFQYFIISMFALSVFVSVQLYKSVSVLCMSCIFGFLSSFLEKLILKTALSYF